MKKKGSKIRTVVRKTVTTVKTTKTTIATSNNSININSLDRGFMISKFSDIKGHVNPKVYNAFDELGFTFKIDSQLKTTGVFSIQNHWIKLKNGRSAYLLHELGHFVSCLKGKNGSKIDTSSEFVRIYNTEKNNYVGYNKGYVTRTSSEFFAEAFRDYTDNPIILKKCCPHPILLWKNPFYLTRKRFSVNKFLIFRPTPSISIPEINYIICRD